MPTEEGPRHCAGKLKGKLKLMPNTIFKTVVAIALAWLLSSPVFGQIPDTVRADLLEREIIAALETDDADKALNAIDEYRQLDVEVPPTVSFTDAELSGRRENVERQRKALEEYFNSADATHTQYENALNMLSGIESVITSAVDAREKALAAVGLPPEKLQKYLQTRAKGDFEDSIRKAASLEDYKNWYEQGDILSGYLITIHTPVSYTHLTLPTKRIV